MFKNRTFVTGLGIGLIAGAVLLQLLETVNGIENRPIADELTLTELKDAAEKQNYKLVPQDERTYTEQEIETLKQKAAEEERQRLAAENNSASAPQGKVIRTVYIPDRTNAADVANILAKANIIAEPEPLINRMKELQLTTKIRYGMYTFETIPELDELIRLLTDEAR